MTNKLISEGTFAMLKEIRDKMNNDPQQNLINEKLVQIEKTCNDLAGKKLVTEDILGQLFAYMLKQIAEMNKKQNEELKETFDRLEQQNTQRPVQKHLHTIDIKSSKVVMTLIGLLLFLFLSLASNIYQWKENAKLSNNDIKYRYIKIYDGIDSKTLHNLETIFEYESNKAKQQSLRQAVEDFERRERERVTEFERARLKEEKANQLLEEAEKLKGRT